MENNNKFLNKNLFLRIISAVVMTGITAFCLMKSNFAFSIFILIITIFAYFEWFTVVSNKLSEQDPEHYAKYMMSWGVIGLIFILPSSASMLYIRDIDGIKYIIYLFCVVASTDIGAYFFGKWIGGPKLAPSISPGKTISGAVFGIFTATMAVSILFFTQYLSDIGYLKLMLITIVISILSQIGDLLESAFKRKFGVKDSSNLIPGHGGFLDRMDGFLISTPAFAIMYFMNIIL